MDYRFENVQHYNQKLFLEFSYKVQNSRNLLWGEAWLVLAVMDIYRALTNDPFRWSTAVVSLGLAVHQLLRPYFKEKKRFKEYLAFYGGETSPARVCFGDIIRIEDHSAVMHMDYGQIRQVISLKYGLFLRYQENAYMAIDPDCFTRGTFPEFKQFLREKRPDLNIPD